MVISSSDQNYHVAEYELKLKSIMLLFNSSKHFNAFDANITCTSSQLLPTFGYISKKRTLTRKMR